MKSRPFLLWLVLCAAPAFAQVADEPLPEGVREFQSKNGKKLKAFVIDVDDAGNAILQRYSPTKAPLKSLSADDQAFLKRWKEEHAKEIAWVHEARMKELYSDPGIRALNGSLRLLDDGEWVPYEPGDPNELQFVVYYFSQEHDEDSVISSLSSTYKKLRKRSNLVEVVYMTLGSADQAVKDYVAKKKFEFPVMEPSKARLAFRADPVVAPLFKGTYPQMVIVDRKGGVIADSNQGKDNNGQFGPALEILEDKIRDYQRAAKSKDQ